MEHVGIDLGMKHSHIAIISAQGVISKEKVVTYELPSWLARRPKSRVVMEACTQSHTIASAALAAGHQTVVVPGAYVRMLGVGARGIKTDDRDAECLANASLHNPTLPGSHLRSAASKERLELVSAREVLLAERRDKALHIKSWLRARLIVVKGRANSPEFASAVRRAAQEEGLQLGVSLDTLLDSFVETCAHVAKLDAEIERFVESDAVCNLLMKMPGIGPVIAYTFTAYVDDPTRFRNADHLASYLALVPGEATTGGKIKRTGTISAGPTHLKAMLVQGAWSMWRSRPNDPIVLWGQAIAEKRGRRIAIIAMARKTATILWSMWRRGSNYNPSRASSSRALPELATTPNKASAPKKASTTPKKSVSRTVVSARRT